MADNSLQRLRPSLRMVAQHMEDMGWTCQARIRDEGILFRSVRIYNPQEPVRPDILYLLDEKMADLPAPDTACISIVDLPEFVNCIHCPDKSGAVILNLVLELFSQCREWEHQIDQAVYSNVSLEELCQLGEELLGNPVCIHDDWFLLTAMSRDFARILPPEYEMYSARGSVPKAIVEDFHHDNDYLETYTHRTAHIWDPGEGEMASLYVNLWDGSVYMGRLLVVRSNRDFRAADFPLAEVLTQRAVRLLRQQKLDDPRKTLGMDNLVLDLLLGRRQDAADYAQLLNILQWERGDCFLCAQVRGQQALSAVQEHSLHGDLFRVFPGSYILLSSGQQILLINLTRSALTPGEVGYRLAPLCRDYCLYAGISSPVSGIQETSAAYQQAELALNHAFGERNEKWIMSFQECALVHILNSLSSPLPLRHLAAPCLQMLADHDREKGTQYFETLGTYLLMERDIPKTAQALIIHRTTLLYRLNKIQSLIKLDLNDSDVRLYLLLSLKILERGKR